MPAHDGWAIIADGMGGHAAGQIASVLAVECLREIAASLHDEEDVVLALRTIHAAMFSTMHKSPALSGMGTTVAGVILSAEDALCFNVGDSRIYHMGSSLTLVSEDHTAEGFALTQCLGGQSAFEPLDPSQVRISWKKGQRLLLCTDGLTDMLDNARIASILQEERHSPAEALVTAALDFGGRDNVTVIVLERLV